MSLCGFFSNYFYHEADAQFALLGLQLSVMEYSAGAD